MTKRRASQIARLIVAFIESEQDVDTLGLVAIDVAKIAGPSDAAVIAWRAEYQRTSVPTERDAADVALIRAFARRCEGIVARMIQDERAWIEGLGKLLALVLPSAPHYYDPKSVVVTFGAKHNRDPLFKALAGLDEIARLMASIQIPMLTIGSAEAAVVDSSGTTNTPPQWERLGFVKSAHGKVEVACVGSRLSLALRGEAHVFSKTIAVTDARHGTETERAAAALWDKSREAKNAEVPS